MTTTTTPATSSPASELDWIKLRQDMDQLHQQESAFERMKRKFKAQPLVPIGCLGTTAALVYGLQCFRRGNSMWSQYMMRTRVMAQFFTISVAIIGTISATAGKGLGSDDDDDDDD